MIGVPPSAFLSLFSESHSVFLFLSYVYFMSVLVLCSVLCICIYIINGTIEYRGSPLGKVCFQRMSTLRLSINPLASLFFDVQRPNPNPGCGFESKNKHFNIKRAVYCMQQVNIYHPQCTQLHDYMICCI